LKLTRSIKKVQLRLIWLLEAALAVGPLGTEGAAQFCVISRLSTGESARDVEETLKSWAASRRRPPPSMRFKMNKATE